MSTIFIWYIVFLTIQPANCDLITQENTDLENHIISFIVSEFPDHNVIFHYDNTNLQKIDSIIIEASIKGTMIIQNYALPIQIRPIGYKFLHVILLKNYTQFNEYTGISVDSLTYMDVLLFIINPDTENETPSISFQYWPNHRLDKAGSMFLLNTWNFTLYSVCFYCGRKAQILQNIAILSTNCTNNYNLSVSLVNIHQNQFKDFNGFVFNIAYRIYRPYFWARIVSIQNKSSANIHGPEAAFIHILNQKLHMKLYMEGLNTTENNSNMLVELVANDTFDLAVGGITLTNQRMEIVDFSVQLYPEAYTILFAVYEDPWMSFLNIVFPFDFLVWLNLLLTVVVISWLFSVAVKLTNMRDNMGFITIFWKFVRLLSEQSIPKIISMTSRVSPLCLMILWLQVALIMTNSYKSKLTSFLITSRAQEFHSIDELLQQNFNYLVNKKDSFVVKEYLKNSDDTKLLETLKHIRNDSEFCELIMYTSHKKWAVIDEETNFQYNIDKHCPEVINSTLFSRLRLTRIPLFLISKAIPMQKNAPFRDGLNRIISRLHAAGLFQHWLTIFGKITSPIRKTGQGQSNHGLRKFSLDNLVGPATVWCLGIVAAGLAFILEIVKYKYR